MNEYTNVNISSVASPLSLIGRVVVLLKALWISFECRNTEGLQKEMNFFYSLFVILMVETFIFPPCG